MWEVLKGGIHDLNSGLEKNAAKIQNLKYLGHQSFEAVEDLFDVVAIFVGTYNLSPKVFQIPSCRYGVGEYLLYLPELISKNNLRIVAESILGNEKIYSISNI